MAVSKKKPRAESQSIIRVPSLTRTLGPLVVNFIESELVHGPGDIQGDRIELDDEMVRFLLAAYEVDARGRRVIRRAVFSRPKGRAKSEFAAMIACAEALGPVRFAGWGEDGRPLGMPVKAPVIPVAATEEGQAGDTYNAIEFMLNNGAISATPGLDVGMTRTYLPDGGVIRPITARATSKDGGKETFAIFDETHLYVLPELVRLHETIRRNLTKRRAAEPWCLETSTMYAPDENSVAESSHAYATKIREGTINDPTFLFDHRQGPDEFEFDDDDQLRAALMEAYGEAAAWMDIERMILEARDPQTLESDVKRYFVNVATKRENAWLPALVWKACEDADRVVGGGEKVVIGFDGSERRDATALVGCTLDGHLFVIDAWERPEKASKEWRVPRDEVDVAVHEAMRTYDVQELVCDPWGWRSEMQEWADEYGERVVEFAMRPTKQAPATSKFTEAVLDKTLTHDGDPRLARHVGNAVRKPLREGFFVDKPNENRKIDLAVAAILAYDRATEAVAVEPFVIFV